MKKLVLCLSVLLLMSCNYNNNNKDNRDKINPKETPKPHDKKIGVGTITSIADGFDVRVVNLWSSTISSRKIVDKMYQGDTVIILRDEEPYFYLELAKSKVKGYCMKDFVIPVK